MVPPYEGWTIDTSQALDIGAGSDPTRPQVPQLAKLGVVLRPTVAKALSNGVRAPMKVAEEI